MGRQFKLCYFLILECLTLDSSFNIDVCVYVCVHVNRGSIYMICFQWGLQPSGDHSLSLKERAMGLADILEEGVTRHPNMVRRPPEHRSCINTLTEIWKLLQLFFFFPNKKHNFSLLLPFHNIHSCELVHAWCHNKRVEVIYQVTSPPVRCPCHLKAGLLQPQVHMCPCRHRGHTSRQWLQYHTEEWAVLSFGKYSR